METFDYVIVGAGTAGCVVASRLSADGKASVLLLEAGGSERRPMIQVPIGYARLLFAPAINWMYETDSDPGIAGRKSFWPRGKVVGGTGSINAMVYMRGLPRDFDDWQAMGNPGWGYRDVLPFFRDVMNVTDVTQHVHPLCEVYLATAQALGYAFTTDFNSDAGEGVGIYRINTRKGIRSSSAREYLRPALTRRNLTLRTRAHVSRILLKERRAAGV